MVPVSAAIFEPRFYERRAQRHLAALAGVPVWINVPWGLTGNPASRPEVDAIWFRSGRAVAAEVKAHQVDAAEAGEITGKYRSLGFRELIVIAPGFTPSASRSLALTRHPAAEQVPFSPDPSEVAGFYQGSWQERVPAWVHDALATGLHHVRFVLTQPTARGRFVIGLPRTRVYHAGTITRAISALPSPPARVLWTPQRFTIPRDVIARGSRLTALGGHVAVDIDGDRMHRADHACQLAPGTAGCPHCLPRAERELRRLDDRLGHPPWTDVLLSGGRGIHAYLPDDSEARRLVLAAAGTGIRIDASVTASLKTTIAMPGTLHAANGQPVASRAHPAVPADSPMAAAC